MKPSHEWLGVAHRNLRQEWRGTSHTTHQPQCVRQPREGRGRNRQPPPPPRKKKQGGEGGGARKQPTATKPPANNTKGGRTPHPEGTEDRTPKEAQGDHPAKTGNTKPGTAAHREKGHRNMQTHTTRNKKKAGAQPQRKGMGGQTTRPGTGTPSNRHHKRKGKKAQKTHPDNPAQKGGAQPRPGHGTHAHTAHRKRKRRGASETRMKPHTSHKQAAT